MDYISNLTINKNGVILHGIYKINLSFVLSLNLEAVGLKIEITGKNFMSIEKILEIGRLEH